MIDNMKLKIEKYYLYLTVFITGAVVLMLEILGTRIISPYFGNTIYVWSSLISVTIISLAIGYYLGGIIADRKPTFNLLYIIIIFIGLSILAIPKIDSTVLIFANSFGIRFGALIATFIIFTIPMILLGIIAPFAIKLKANELSKIGTTAGNLYAIATLGSFVGAILTGFFLIPLMGIRAIITIFALLLFIISGAWFLINGEFRFLTIFFLVIPLLFISPVESDGNEVIYSTQSLLGYVKVVDKSVYRILLVDGSPQSWVEKGSLQSSVGFTKRAKLVFFLNPEIENVLVLGLGSGSLSTELEKFNLTVDTIEIDENIVQVAKDFFGFNGSAFVEDGRHFIRNSEKTYDAIIFDVSSGDALPIHLYSIESFAETQQILSKDGILVVHMSGLIDSEKIKSVYKTIDSVFENVFVIKTGDSLTSSVIFFATDGNFDKDFAKENIKKYVPSRGMQDSFIYIIDNDWVESLDGGIVITDDYNPLDLWQIDSMEAWREYSWNYFGNMLVE